MKKVVFGGAMLRQIDYKDLKDNYILIDVRSPGEYLESTIPGAVNIPIFNDEERALIGYTYINESVEKAKKIGVEAVSKRLPSIYEELSKLDKEYKKLVVFCARGGMRSTSICSLLGSLGVNTYKLSGGYKGYRGYINEELPKANEGIKYVVLHGQTGVGKTELLKCLKDKGMDVLDLEEAANHRGSLLGNVGLGSPRSQKQFEALIYNTLKNRKTNYVFIEAESKRIGNIIVPNYIYRSLENGIHILVEADIDFRTRLIIKEYTKEINSVEDILDSLDALKKHISESNIERYKGLVLEGCYEEVVKELMVKYYDPLYANSIKKYEYDLTIKVANVEEECEFLVNWLDNFVLKGRDN
jgi:tRNA 2-selenouridine synthase